VRSLQDIVMNWYVILLFILAYKLANRGHQRTRRDRLDSSLVAASVAESHYFATHHVD
jgi:hypothetical protein